MRNLRVVGIASGVVLAVGLAGPAVAAPDDHDSVLESLVAAAEANPESLALDDVAESTSAPGVAAGFVSDGASATVPVDPSDGIVVSSEFTGTSLALELPVAEEAGNASIIADGVVAFDNGDGSVSVPIIKDDASVQVTTIIAEPSAPTTYAYGLSIPDGGRIEETEGGALIVLDADGVLQGGVAPPWASDADGRAVPTRYVVTATGFTQVVEHDSGDFTYPVVADPFLGIAMVSSYRWESSTRILVTPTGWARAVYPGNVASAPLAGNPGFDELRAKQTSTANRNKLGASARNQYICHVAAAPLKSTWNLETDKANKGYLGFIASACN